MVATVLNSPMVIKMSFFVALAFVQLREMLSTHKELAEKLDALERKLSSHDQAISRLINAIRELMHIQAPLGHPIGFTVKTDEKG